MNEAAAKAGSATSQSNKCIFQKAAIVFFAKLIRIITGIFIIWLIFHGLQQLGRKKSMAHRMKQGDDSHKRRKFVESHIIENSGKNDDKAQS